MPPRSKVYTLPAEVRATLDGRLIDSGFGGYRGLSEWLAEQGYQIGKSALAEYGADLETDWDLAMGRLNESGRLAEQFVARQKDGAGGVAMTKTSIRLAQDAILRLQIGLDRVQQDPAEMAKIWPSVVRALADVGRLDLAVAKFDADQQRAGADALTERAAADGQPVTPERLREIAREIYGV